MKLPLYVKFIVWIYRNLYREEFKFPLQSEENLEFKNLKDLVWLLHKMDNHPVEVGEKGKHLEQYFAAQDLDFSAPQGFAGTTAVVLTAGGDLLSSRDATPETTKHLWDDVQDFLFSGDACCANLETPVVPSRAVSYLPEAMSSKFALNNSPEMFDVIHRGGKGVNVFSTANNHSLDMGEAGLLETLQFLDSKGCVHVGTSSSQQEREDFPVIEKNGIRLAFLSYTYSLNGRKVPAGKDHLVNYIRLNKPGTDISMIARHVRRARLEKGADFVVACLHWSNEFESYPLQSLIDTGHAIMELGVDVILGNHAHGIQPLEKYSYQDPFTGQGKNGLIVYALGDLIGCTEKSDGVPNSRVGNLLRVEISRGSRADMPSTLITGLKMLPVYFLTKMENGRCTDYRLLNLDDLLNELDAGTNRNDLTPVEVSEVQRLGRLVKKILNT